MEAVASYLDRFQISVEFILIVGIGLGVLLMFWSFAAGHLGQASPAARRMAAIAGDRRQARLDRAILAAPGSAPNGLLKPFVPSDVKERSELEKKLSQAGFASENALHWFTAIRVFLGLVLPGLLLALIFISKSPPIGLPFGLVKVFSTLTRIETFQLLSVLVGVGYFGPTYWLNARMAERKRRIEESFPNALDLIRISMEAGLGFDAAMTRVGNELASVSPEISREFLNVQRQIQAGRDRRLAMQDLADRTGVDIVRSFTSVILQSMQLGTSMSRALTAYADELRTYREVRAQEMANKLPVKMSAVLASLMLPALILLTLGPVLIRYIRYFSG